MPDDSPKVPRKGSNSKYSSERRLSFDETLPVVKVERMDTVRPVTVGTDKNKQVRRVEHRSSKFLKEKMSKADRSE